MATQIADRLTVQEREIRWLNDEITNLLELGTQGTMEIEPSQTLLELRAENEKLKYRVAHLQKSLKEEEERAGPENGAQDAARPEGSSQQQPHVPVCGDTGEVFSIVE